jgi:hypothetical protein
MGIYPDKKRFYQAQLSLACVNRNYLYVVLFNKKLLRIDFKMNETQRFIEKHSFVTVCDLPGISELESNAGVPFGVFATNTDLIVLDKTRIGIYD